MYFSGHYMKEISENAVEFRCFSRFKNEIVL